MKSNEVLILGAGGHCRAAINLLELNEYRIRGIIDETYDCNKQEVIFGYPIIGRDVDGVELVNAVAMFLAVGDNLKRKELFEMYKKYLLQENLTHPLARIEKRVSLGKCNQIYANTLINAGAQVGDNNIINTGSILEHEVAVGSHNHISVGTILCGRVKVGDNCFIGAGSVVIDKVRVCDNVIIGANSVVIKDIEEPGTYVGNPVRRVK